MTTVEEVQLIRQAIDRLGREVGEIEGSKKRLVEDLARSGFDTLEAAKKALPDMRKKLEALEKQRDNLIRQFWLKHDERLKAGKAVAQRQPQ